MAWLVLILTLLAVGSWAPSAYAENRFALVIGNNTYPHLDAGSQLHKAINDAKTVGDALEKDGFTVMRGADLTRSEMVDKLADLADRIQPGDMALFYFAGHGVTLGGGNYILPSDVPAARPGEELRLQGQSIAEADIVASLQDRGARVSVVILDACRDNPFRKPGVRSIGGERGFARILETKGVFSLYSAGIGQSALDELSDDDPNPNSVFTRVLAPLLTQPGLNLDDLAHETMEKVSALALTSPDRHEQIPAYYDQIIGGRVYLAGLPPATAPPPETACGTLVDENDGKDAILRKDLIAALQTCARAFVDHPENERLKHLLEVAQEQNAFQRALRSPDRTLSEAYLVLYPSGRFAEDVRSRLASLGAPAPPPTIVTPPLVGPAPLSPAEIARRLQAELKRVGCDPLSQDGVWGPSSERALAAFNQDANSSFDVKTASLEAVEAVRSKPGVVCRPPPVPAGPPSNSVSAPPKPAPASTEVVHGQSPPPSRRPPPPRPAPIVERRVVAEKPANREKHGKCFQFQGASFCN